MNNTIQKPEIEELERLLGDYDDMLQEGAIYTTEEKTRILSLIKSLQSIALDLNTFETR